MERAVIFLLTALLGTSVLILLAALPTWFMTGVIRGPHAIPSTMIPTVLGCAAGGIILALFDAFSKKAEKVRLTLRHR